jgi:hypothetical protein
LEIKLSAGIINQLLQALQNENLGGINQQKVLIKELSKVYIL